jgi:hypothetical protein
MITTNLTGNLGNHMWQYSVCRTVAEKLGYKWGINSSPTHDYHNGMNQMYFMDVDFGQSITGSFTDFHEKWTTHNGINEFVNITTLDERVWSIKDNTKLIGHNGAFGGIYQSERYFEGFEDTVRSWFKIKEEYSKLYDEKLIENNIILDENTCVINFRGGEYRNIRNVLCRPEYWKDSINLMLSFNPNMKFILITDDTFFAKSFIPFDIPTYHFDIGLDFYIINKSKWLIISNSSFGWWASWLNVSANKILAPKYWASHNNSNGYWSTGDSYSKPFSYVGRDGLIYSYEQCKSEAENFNKQNITI